MCNKRLIVTADDFGLSEGVNRAIIRAHKEGIVTSTSFMVNGRAAESAVELARQNPSLDIGLHLNLTNKPFALLVNSTGRDLEGEIRGQIEAVLATGLPVSHIDGHKHVHVIPAVLKILQRVLPEYGIRAIRSMKPRTPKFRSLLARNPGWRKAIVKQYVFARGAALMWRFCSQKQMAGPDHFYGVAETGFLDLDAFRNIIRDLRPGVQELMCHPGYADAELRKTPTRLLEQRERELEMLTGFEARDLIRSAGIELASYRDLVETYGNHRTGPVLHRYSAL